MADYFGDHFALLTPCNEAAIKAASHVYDRASHDRQRYRHHLRNMICGQRRVRLRTLLQPGATSPSSAADTPGSPSEVSSSEATVPDEENDPMAELVWSMQYSFSLVNMPLLPRFGWTAGYGHGWEKPEDCGKVDILLGLGVDNRPDHGLKSKHARFNFVLPSGQFGVRQGKRAAVITTDGAHVSEHFCLLIRNEVLLSLSGLQYRFTYTVPQRDEAKFQASKNTYFSKEMQIALPNGYTSATPSTNDVHFDRWTILSTAGAGSQSVVRSAVSSSGVTAAVIRKEYHRHKDRNAADPLLELLEEIRGRLGQRNSRGRNFVAKLYDSFQSRAEELYIILVPLGLTSFDGLLFQQNHQCHTKLFCQVVAGVAALHDAGFLHNDLKPTNLVVETFDPPKAVIIDLAGAIDMSSNGGSVLASPGHGGTVGYLAPEREAWSSDQYGFASDIWSLGTVGLQLLIKKNRYAPFDQQPQANPFRDIDLSDMEASPDSNKVLSDSLDHSHQLRKQAFDCLRTLKLHAQQQPEGVESLLAKLLVLNPAKRISAEEALRYHLVEDLLNDNANTHPGSKRKLP